MINRPDLDRIFVHLSLPPAQDADPIATMRVMVEGYAMGAVGEGIAACDVVPVHIGDMEAEWLVPPEARVDRRIVHLHGGGWVAGSIASHRSFAAEIALRSRQAVLLPGYRLAPEHPFPSALDDCSAALLYAQSNGPLGPLAAEVSVSGDSAGGNLAAAVAAKCIELGINAPTRLWLISPFLSPMLSTDRFHTPLRDPIVDAAATAGVAGLYAPNQTDDPHVAPLLTATKTLSAFPQTLLQISAAEALREQAISFADRAWQSGAWLRLSMWPDMPHVWPVFTGLIPEADGAIAEAALFLNS